MFAGRRMGCKLCHGEGASNSGGTTTSSVLPNIGLAIPFPMPLGLRALCLAKWNSTAQVLSTLEV
jgi:hypothetical protein